MPEALERIVRPRAGWLSLGLLAIMALALAWSVQGAEWLPSLEFLVPVALLAVMCGAVLGVLPITVVVTLPAGALAGGLVVLWVVGGDYFPELGEAERIYALRNEMASWILVALRTGYPTELTPYALGLGVLMWVTSFMAAYTVYRHHRVLDAILLLGVAMITNMSATYADLFTHLVLFVAAALLLWLRATLVVRQEAWQRRGVSETFEVPATIMRNGMLFGAGSIALAWALTSVAVAAPLTGAWNSLDGVWTEVRDRFDGVFGSLTNPDSRITGNSFGASFTVTGSWVSDEAETLRVTATRPLYLRTATYDEYTGRGWRRGEAIQRTVPAGEPLFAGPTPERPTVAAAVEIETITIEFRETLGRNLFTSGSPLTIFAPAVVHETGGQPVLGGLTSTTSLSSGDGYWLTAALSIATKAELGVAGTDYPAAVTALYLDDSEATPRVRQLARQITAEATNPYQQAEAVARYLSSDASFAYRTTAPVAPLTQDMVDYFLFDPNGRIGYCQHYASAMVLMARTLGLPARVAAGFAPGERQEDGTYLVREANAHTWAEVYFPGYGWEIFEATPSIDPGFTRASGDPATARPPSTNQIDLFELEPGALDLPSIQPIPGAFPPDQSAPVDDPQDARGGNILLISAIALAAVVFIWLRARHLRRRWRMLPAGDRAWQQLTLAADRAGVGPRPAETIYEYAGWLEAQLPRHGRPIRTVADGKVWQTYSGRRLSWPATRRLEAAIRSLRLPLLLLTVRRTLRNLVRRR